MAPNISLFRMILWLVFIVYILVLMKFVLFKYSISVSYVMEYLESPQYWESLKHRTQYTSNYTPFRTINSYMAAIEHSKIAFQNIVGNIVIFIPFGFILPILIEKSRKYAILYGFFCSLALESIQLILGWGQFDVDDLILNTFGVMLGFIFIVLIQRLAKTVRQKEDQAATK